MSGLQKHAAARVFAKALCHIPVVHTWTSQRRIKSAFSSEHVHRRARAQKMRQQACACSCASRCSVPSLSVFAGVVQVALCSEWFPPQWGSAGLGLRLAREEETEVLAVSLCGPAHTNGDLARDGVSKRLLRRATPCRRPKIRTWRRPPPHGMQQAASATSATPHSTMRSPLATRGVAGLFRQQGRGVQANETQVRGAEVEGRRWVPYSGSTPSSSAGNLRREGGLRGPWCKRSRGGWPTGRHWAPPAKCVKAHVNLSYSCWVRRVRTVPHASPLASYTA